MDRVASILRCVVLRSRSTTDAKIAAVEVAVTALKKLKAPGVKFLYLTPEVPKIKF